MQVQCNDGVSGPMGPGGLPMGVGTMQTIVHTPHGIHTMGPHGHMSVVQQHVVSANSQLMCSFNRNVEERQ